MRPMTLPRGRCSRCSPRCAARRRGGDRTTTRRRRTRRATSSQQGRRRQGRRRDADRLGPGGPRRPGGADQAAQRGVPGASTRTSRSSASRSRSTTSTRRSSSRSRATNAPDVVQANQGRPVMGQLVKGGLLRPLDAYAEGLRLERPLLADAARPQPLLGRRQASSAPATSTASRRWARSSASSTTRTRCPTPPATFAEFERSLRQAKADGRVPISFGNLDKLAGHPRVPDRAEPVRRQAGVRDFVFAKDGASFDTPENQRGRDEAPGVGRRRATSRKDFNGTGYDPAWQQFAKGKGPFLIARHVAHRRPLEGDGRQASASC